MKEIDIFSYNKKDVNNTKYDYPVKLVIKKSSFKTYKQKLTTSNKSTITFNNVIFNNEISINIDEQIDDEISISFHNCFIDSFSDFALVSKKLSLYFGSTIIKNLRAQSENLKLLKLNNCFGYFFAQKVKNVDISYTEENIFPRKWFNNIKSTEQLNSLLSSKTILHLTDVESISIYGHEVNEKRKEELIKEKKLKENGKYSNFTINNQDVKDLRLRRLLSKKEKSLLDFNVILNYSIEFNHKKTSIRNIPLNSISFKGKAKGEILVEDCRVDNIYIREFSPKTDFVFYNIEPRTKEKGKFEVNNSNLDNTWFNSVNLKEYFVVFHKSSFINTKFSSTLFPNTSELLNANSFTSVKNIHYPDEKPAEKLFYRNMYELFIELKQAFEKRGNIFEAQKMKAVAHNYLYKIEDWKIYKADFWNNKVVLGLNRLSNFHGISIKNAFVSALIIIIIFHSLNVLSFNSIKFGYNNWDDFKSIVWSNKRYLFAIANPTHKISSLGLVNEITGWTYMFSFLSRISISYVYFQFISAFRRFGK